MLGTQQGRPYSHLWKGWNYITQLATSTRPVTFNPSTNPRGGFYGDCWIQRTVWGYYEPTCIQVRKDDLTALSVRILNPRYECILTLLGRSRTVPGLQPGTGWTNRTRPGPAAKDSRVGINVSNWSRCVEQVCLGLIITNLNITEAIWEERGLGGGEEGNILFASYPNFRTQFA